MITSGHSFRLISHKKTTKTLPDVTPATKERHNDSVESDSKKRSFLKLAGVVGVGAAATMLIPKKAEALVFGSTPTSNTVGLKDGGNNRINPAKEDGNLATLVTSNAPFLVPTAGAYIQQDSNATIAKESGGNLAAIATNTANLSNLSTVVSNTTKLTSLTFDGSGNLLTAAAGGAASAVGLKDTTSTLINPATDDSVTYLRRIVKLMESQAVVDGASRQRVNIDAFGTNAALVIGTGASGAGIPRVTVSSDSGVVLQAGANAIGSLTAGAAVIGSLTNVATIAGQNQQMYQDVARNAFANGIRNNLAFS